MYQGSIVIGRGIDSDMQMILILTSPGLEVIREACNGLDESR